MEKEFVPYELALRMKALGFDEPCFGYYDVDEGYSIGYAFCYSDRESQPEIGCSAPTFSQAFRWFRENHGLIYSIGHIGHTNTWAYEIINMRIAGPDYGYGETYEEAELACLKKLIEIVKK